MEEKANNLSSLGTRYRLVIIAVIVWIVLQLPRLIAIPLIQDVLAGIDSPAWMFPAILDIVVAVTAPFVAFAIWRRRGLVVWGIAIVFFIVSIVDHMDSVTTSLLTGTPRVFGGMEGPSPTIVSSTQMVIDFIALILLTRPKIMSYYLGAFRSADSAASR